MALGHQQLSELSPFAKLSAFPLAGGSGVRSAWKLCPATAGETLLSPGWLARGSWKVQEPSSGFLSLVLRTTSFEIIDPAAQMGGAGGKGQLAGPGTGLREALPEANSWFPGFAIPPLLPS